MSLLKGYSMIMFGGGACVIPFLNLFNSSKNAGEASPSTHHVPTSAPVAQPSSPSPSFTLPSSEVEANSKTHPKSLLETKQIKELDNCQFKAEQEKVEVPELIESSTSHIYFACDNKSQEEEIITSKWNIWVPKSLLKEPQISLVEGQRVKIKTASSDAELASGDYTSDRYITTFESDIFSKNTITGTWGGQPLEDESSVADSFLYKVTITDPKSENVSLYLRWFYL